MPDTATRVESLKGRQQHFGPGLEKATADTVYVGRVCYLGGWRLPASAYANPFTARSFGQQGAVDEFRNHLRANPLYVKRIRRDLHGKTLLCWCKPGTPCHANLLAEIADGAEP